MDDDVCHDRQCWASVNGHFTGDVLEGGRVDATTWPVQPGQAIDVWFNKSTDPGPHYILDAECISVRSWSREPS